MKLWDPTHRKTDVKKKNSQFYKDVALKRTNQTTALATTATKKEIQGTATVHTRTSRRPDVFTTYTIITHKALRTPLALILEGFFSQLGSSTSNK